MTKIYEIRDISDDETYYTQGFFSDREVAIGHVKSPDGYQLSDYAEDVVRIAVYEHTLDKWKHEAGAEVRLLEVRFEKNYEAEENDEEWKMQVEFEKTEDSK